MKKLRSINFKSRILASLAAIALVFGAVFTAPVAHAEESSTPKIWIQVSPVNNRVTLNAKEELMYIFNIDNIGAQEFTVKVYASPYHVVDDKYNIDFSSETNRTQLSRWMDFRKNGTKDEFKKELTLTIPAGGRQSVEYRITVPADIPAGGQYASVVTEYVPTSNSGGTGVTTVPRVNMLVYGTTNGDTEESAEMTEHDITGFLVSGNAKATSVVTNTGNTDFVADYHLKVESLFGKTVYENSAINDVLPDTSRRFEMEWEETPMFGIFRATSTVKVLGQEYTKTKLVLVIPVFVIIIIILLLTILIVWIIILVRKRQAQKSRVIV
ncbi:MAG: hypothetical protein Q4E47_00600 [Candidatus Saccharibacteria bacterium]|nr:hypothetical protein [Candidatus Saccharibacteria bacterium]